MSPLQWFVAALYGCLLREQDDVIAFLREENRVLRAHLRGRRLQLCDEERRRLAVLGHPLGRAALAQGGASAASLSPPHGCKQAVHYKPGVAYGSDRVALGWLPVQNRVCDLPDIVCPRRKGAVD